LGKCILLTPLLPNDASAPWDNLNMNAYKIL